MILPAMLEHFTSLSLQNAWLRASSTAVVHALMGSCRPGLPAGSCRYLQRPFQWRQLLQRLEVDSKWVVWFWGHVKVHQLLHNVPHSQSCMQQASTHLVVPAMDKTQFHYASGCQYQVPDLQEIKL